ncbi:MAG: hemolysin III family protein [FCB group bacterium]|nr:hemolysin III family protein [FCB group bacterium]
MKNADISVSSLSPEFKFERNARFTPKEESANTISHGAGVLLSLYALIVMLITAIQSGTALKIVSVSIYGLSLLAVYLSSTLTHALAPGRWKDHFHNIDQIAIYLLIAGTYTPLALITLRHDWGWVIFGIEWGLAIGGIMLKLLMPDKFERGVNVLIIASYVIMGWLLLLFLLPLYRNIDPGGITLILIGGLCYTVGIAFFKLEKINHNHLMWHILVLAGSITHWVAIMIYVL